VKIIRYLLHSPFAIGDECTRSDHSLNGVSWDMVEGGRGNCQRKRGLGLVGEARTLFQIISRIESILRGDFQIIY
jgi:hypothetical protein